MPPREESFMRTAVVTGVNSIEMQDRDAPVVRTGHVLVAPRYVGLCGSDLSYFRTGANGAFVIREPLTLGHEIAAEVIAVADGTSGAFAIGDRVVVHPAWPCPPAGQKTVPAALAAESPSFLGSASTWPHTHGALTELLQVRPEQLRRLPDGLPSRRAALAEPLAVVLHALDRHPAGFDGARVLVCGAGPIGLLTVVALKRRGAAHVAVTDLHPRPLEIAASIGADQTFQLTADPEGGAMVPADAYEVAVEATGAAASLDTALSALAPAGVLIQLGMLKKGTVSADLSAVVVKELSLLGSHRFLGELDSAIELLSVAAECDAIITDVLPFDAIAEALRRAGDPATSSKVLVEVCG